MKYEPPKAILADYVKEGDITRITLFFEKVPSPPLVPATFGYPDQPEGFIELYKVESREGNSVTFISDDPLPPTMRKNAAYPFQTWWIPGQLDAARSDPGEWQQKEFVSSDMLAFRNQDGSTWSRKLIDGEDTGNGFIVPGDWGHEHCVICWKTISEAPQNEHIGYVNKSDWLCQECYEKYISSGFGKTIRDLEE